MEHSRRKTGFATLIVMAGTAISRLLGFARQAVVSAVFGGGAIADILNAVILIPNNLRKLLAEGALSTAFVPVLSRTIHAEQGHERSQRYMSAMFGFQLAVLVPLLLACVVLAEPLSQLLFHFDANVTIPASIMDGTGASQNMMAVAAQLFPWVMHYLLFVSFSAVLMAILNVHDHFLTPSIAPLLFSLSVILCLVLFSQSLSVWAQVLGVLLGGFLQLSVLVVAFYKTGYRLSFDFRFWRNADFRSMIGLYLPVLAASSIFTVTEIVAVSFATSLGEGSTSAITNAVIFWQLPFGIFSASISTVLFPKVASYLARNLLAETRDVMLYGLRVLVYLLVPSSLLLIVLGREMIAVALQRGMFLPQDTALTALVLQGYAFGMVFMGMSGFLQRCFYAAKNHKIPVKAAIIIGVVDILLSIAGIWLGFGALALAVANTIASIVGTVVLLAYARSIFGNLSLESLLPALAKALIASIPMVAGILVFLQFDSSFWMTGSTLSSWIKVLVLCVGSGLSVLLMFRVLKVDELMILLSRNKKEPSREVDTSGDAQ